MPETGSFRCDCVYGRRGEFCQDVDEEPPFTGTTVNWTTATTASAVAVETVTWSPYTTVNSTSTFCSNADVRAENKILTYMRTYTQIYIAPKTARDRI